MKSITATGRWSGKGLPPFHDTVQRRRDRATTPVLVDADFTDIEQRVVAMLEQKAVAQADLYGTLGAPAKKDRDNVR